MKLSADRKRSRARNRRDSLERMARCFELSGDQAAELIELMHGQYEPRDR